MGSDSGDWRTRKAVAEAEEHDEITRLQSALSAVTRERDEERAIVSRIWNLLGSPTYEELKGRSIYDLIIELRDKAALSSAPAPQPHSDERKEKE